MEELKHSEISGKIIKAFYTVYNGLGYGFLEKVYENAMIVELRSLGLHVEQQKGISVFYRETLVGEYFADLIVENVVIVELKSVETCPRSRSTVDKLSKGDTLRSWAIVKFWSITRIQTKDLREQENRSHVCIF